MENKSHAVAAGLFTIALGIALALAVIWLNRDTTQRVPYELVTISSVSGLSPQSSVRFRGLEVGKVESIRFDPDHPGQILIRIDVEKGTPIFRSTYAVLGYQGVTGLAYIQLDDDGKNTALLDSSLDHVARIEIRPGLLDRLQASGEGIITHLNETINHLNDVLSSQNQKVLIDTLQSAGDAARQLTRVETEAEPALKALPKTLASVDRSLSSIDALAADYSALAVKLDKNDGLLDRMAGSLDRFDIAARTLNNETLPKINVLSEDLSHSARSASRTIDQVGSQPQAILFGPRQAEPGPGEPGFVSPR